MHDLTAAYTQTHTCMYKYSVYPILDECILFHPWGRRSVPSNAHMEGNRFTTPLIEKGHLAITAKTGTPSVGQLQYSYYSKLE